jgi:hypothetical protein
LNLAHSPVWADAAGTKLAVATPATSMAVQNSLAAVICFLMFFGAPCSVFDLTNRTRNPIHEPVTGKGQEKRQHGKVRAHGT